MYLDKHVNPNFNDNKMVNVQKKFEKRLNAYIPGTCPLSQQLALLQTSITQSCGKCVPCRDGLKTCALLLQDIVNTSANEKTFNELKNLAQTIKDTADCAIGYDAAQSLLDGFENFKDEYDAHINLKQCKAYNLDCAPCVSHCPAHVDIPAYVSLIENKKYKDAVRVIRNDNPFVTACAYVCEHPCEAKCRRSILDDSINIKGLKRFAVDQANTDKVENPTINENTYKNIAVIGGGPSGLSAAYYLALMGHNVTIFEMHKKLGGMLQYGIPNYRLPKNRLMQDIKMIKSLKNIKVKTNTKVGVNVNYADITDKYDAVYVAIGAQNGKNIKLDGIKAKGVYSAVDVLYNIGDGNTPDYTNKKVVVVGGGNVAMDAARTAVRCNAKEVSILYRRRQEDMTALDTEVQAAIEEGVELLTLYAPKKIETNKNGKVNAFIAAPQMISSYDGGSRPKPVNADGDDLKIKCDIVLMAIGQDIDSNDFDAFGIDERRKNLIVNESGSSKNSSKTFAGGDCVLGPATVIKAVAAGKQAAINIDEYLGYHHSFKENIKTPDPKPNNRDLYGRVQLHEVPAKLRKNNFKEVETGLSLKEAMQECGKCLRCDHFGCNTIEGDK